MGRKKNMFKGESMVEKMPRNILFSEDVKATVWQALCCQFWFSVSSLSGKVKQRPKFLNFSFPFLGGGGLAHIVVLRAHSCSAQGAVHGQIQNLGRACTRPLRIFPAHLCKDCSLLLEQTGWAIHPHSHWGNQKKTLVISDRPDNLTRRFFFLVASFSFLRERTCARYNLHYHILIAGGKEWISLSHCGRKEVARGSPDEV